MIFPAALILQKLNAETLIFLPVAGLPENSPKFVPEILPRTVAVPLTLATGQYR